MAKACCSKSQQSKIDAQSTTGTCVYNLFYDSINGRPSRSVERETCLNPFKDGSKTRATVPPVCLDYARGRCSRGVTCRRLHRLPAVQDEGLPHSVDIFGRQRSALGPGSFLGKNSSVAFEKPANQQGILTICKHIGPVIEYNHDTVLVVRFKHRIYAEFAIEALSGQRLSTLNAIYNVSLSRDGLVNVNWAHINLGDIPRESVLDLY
ncbi:Hypothetical protein GLP15_350 [Giardia lamblia P15]|uniref:C3H1-type domain-containing protein n=1 Tax=Giardia intestinalis (strain P15) TaxID=658858 RepID=E1F531_GIAIA|nr:Hypothetical protein GLP15_350 [Giardia lamblia P15]